MSDSVRVDRIGDTQQIMLNRPAHRNAMDLEMRAALGEAVIAARDDRTVKALVLTGAGGAFCSGGDIRSQIADRRSVFASRDRIRRVDRWFSELLVLGKPVIAAVDGAAAGGGFPLALAADLIVATPAAFFSAAFVRIGLIPDMSTLFLLPRAVGLQRAKEILFSGRAVGAREAVELGIVHQLCARDRLLDEAMERALALQSAGPDFARAKAMLRRSFQAGIDRTFR